MDNFLLLKSNLIDYFETLEKELKLSICIDKIYYDDCDYYKDILQDKIESILRGYADDELEYNSTIVINKSGEKYNNVQKIIRYLENLDKLKDKGKINKLIKIFHKAEINKIHDLKNIINEIKEIKL